MSDNSNKKPFATAARKKTPPPVKWKVGDVAVSKQGPCCYSLVDQQWHDNGQDKGTSIVVHVDNQVVRGYTPSPSTCSNISFHWSPSMVGPKSPATLPINEVNMNSLSEDVLARIFSYIGGGVGVDDNIDIDKKNDSNLRTAICLTDAMDLSQLLTSVCRKWRTTWKQKHQVIVGPLKTTLSYYDTAALNWMRAHTATVSYIDFNFYCGHGKRCSSRNTVPKQTNELINMAQILHRLSRLLQDTNTSQLVNFYMHGYFLLDASQRTSLKTLIQQQCPLLEKEWIGEHQACFFQKPTTMTKKKPNMK